MLYQSTSATKKILSLNKRIRAIAGGTAASKTISILLFLISMSQADKTPTLTTIVSESMPHLKKGAMRDFLEIMQGHGIYKEEEWNRTDSIYTFSHNKSRIEFFGVEEDTKVHGPRRDRLFINECNNVPFGVYDQLEVRTRQFIFLDWNPTNEFWWYTEVRPHLVEDEDYQFITLTYKDNEALEAAVVKSIESRQHNKRWWTVYGEGQLGVAEGRIYHDWAVVSEKPHEARLVGYGLDFGYTNDPTAIVGINYYNGGYILEELVYERGLSNRQIADIFKDLPAAIVRADNAEPKSIDEIKSYGVFIMPVIKGKDSVRQGIQYVQDQRISVTADSINLIREYRNYLWEPNPDDPNGKGTNVPKGGQDHALDAVRYAMYKANEYAGALEVTGYEVGLGGVEIPIYNLD